MSTKSINFSANTSGAIDDSKESAITPYVKSRTAALSRAAAWSSESTEERKALSIDFIKRTPELQQKHRVIEELKLTHLRKVEAGKLNVDWKAGTMTIPSSYLAEDGFGCIIFAIFEKFAFTKINYLDFKSTLNTSAETQPVLKGIALSFDDTSPLLLSSRKEGIELGRAIGQAVRIQGEFRNIFADGSGMAFLRRDNAFFGNNPKEVKLIKKKEFKVDYLLDVLSSSIFGEPSEKKFFMHLVISALERLRLSDYTDNDHESMLARNVIPFEEVLSKQKRSVESLDKKGKKTKKEKKPAKPGRSPVLLKCESDLLAELTATLWDPLDSFRAEWIKSLFTHGLQKTIKLLQNIINQRWEITQKFAKLTTKRLNQIRKLLESKEKTKRETTVEDVWTLIENRNRAAEVFCDEIASIFPSESAFAYAVGKFFKGFYFAKEAKYALSQQILTLYMTEKVKIPDLEEERKALANELHRDESEINSLGNTVTTFVQFYNALRQRLVAVERYKILRGREKSLSILFDTYNRVNTILREKYEELFEYRRMKSDRARIVYYIVNIQGHSLCPEDVDVEFTTLRETSERIEQLKKLCFEQKLEDAFLKKYIQ
jgi:hypothetical protein